MLRGAPTSSGSCARPRSRSRRSRADQAEIACEAFRRFGRGRHPAGLNIGDTFAYALAKVSGEPLLFKGDDFAQDRHRERGLT